MEHEMQRPHPELELRLIAIRVVWEMENVK